MSKYTDYRSELSCLIINKIAGNLPHLAFATNFVSIRKYIKLTVERYGGS